MNNITFIGSTAGVSPGGDPNDRKDRPSKFSSSSPGEHTKEKKKGGRPPGSKNKPCAFKVGKQARANIEPPALKYCRATQQLEENHRGKIMSCAPQHSFTESTQLQASIENGYSYDFPDPAQGTFRSPLNSGPVNPYAAFAPPPMGNDSQVINDRSEVPARFQALISSQQSHMLDPYPVVPQDLDLPNLMDTYFFDYLPPPPQSSVQSHHSKFGPKNEYTGFKQLPVGDDGQVTNDRSEAAAAQDVNTQLVTPPLSTRTSPLVERSISISELNSDFGVTPDGAENAGDAAFWDDVS